jgi:GntR family transcriptional regulator
LASQRLETKYNLPLVEPEDRLEAVAAQTVVAEALGVETGSPFFRIERTSSCTGNRPVDYEQPYYGGDMVRFVTRLARRRKEGK